MTCEQLFDMKCFSKVSHKSNSNQPVCDEIGLFGLMVCMCVCFIPKMTKSVTCPDELGGLASQVTVDYSQLAVQGRLAAHTAEPEEVRVTKAETIVPITQLCSTFIFWSSMHVDNYHPGYTFLLNILNIYHTWFHLHLIRSTFVLCSVIQIGFQIKSRVQELGHGCIFLVQKAGALQVTPSDGFTKRELIECARAVTEKV